MTTFLLCFQMTRMQSRRGLFSSFKLIHGQADKIDIETQKCIQDMREICDVIDKHRKRWYEIKLLIGVSMRKSKPFQ